MSVHVSHTVQEHLPALIANADLALGLEYWSQSVLCAHVAEELACVLHLPQPNKAQDSE